MDRFESNIGTTSSSFHLPADVIATNTVMMKDGNLLLVTNNNNAENDGKLLLHPKTKHQQPQEEQGQPSPNNNTIHENEHDIITTATTTITSLVPSHILEDGRFIYLPQPTTQERSKFFERSIARHQLLERDMRQMKNQQQQQQQQNENVQQFLQDDDQDDDDMDLKNEETAERKNTKGAVEKTSNIDDDNDNNHKTTSTSTSPLKIHPLAVASARLQANGINELNRAINLATLVQTGEYFSFTNIVDPTLEANAAAAAAAATKSTTATTGPVNTTTSSSSSSAVVVTAAAAASSSSSSTSSSSMIVDGTSQRMEALYCCKRKLIQFSTASKVLKRHHIRLIAGIYAQRIIDQRLFQLRNHWRLVAPEHGIRARLHPPRTNEIIAIDVDVYDRDRVHPSSSSGGGGSNNNRAAAGSLQQQQQQQQADDSRKAMSLAGRLASRVPRFATIELQDGFTIPLDHKTENSKESIIQQNGDKIVVPDRDGGIRHSSPSKNECTDIPMEGNKNTKDIKEDDVEMKDSENNDTKTDSKVNGNNHNPEMSKEEKVLIQQQQQQWTRAEPFAVADPSLGRIVENFDPSKIPVLSLQLDIHKRSSGFYQSARLEPMSTLSTPQDNREGTTTQQQQQDIKVDDGTQKLSLTCDEDLLVSLQHSLFCANLFESMRRELDPDNSVENTKNPVTTFSPIRPKSLQGMAWLSSESDENFEPPPSFLVGGDAIRGLKALSVIHCHEGEVKVQLDSEYQLSLKLVEANAEEENATPSSNDSTRSNTTNQNHSNNHSGTQSPAQLHALCRALLVHAQDVYHRHSLYLRERERNKREEEKAAAARGNGPRGLARIKKEDIPEKARILQSCVSLGSKMLFEKRIRIVLLRVSRWVQTRYEETIMHVEWLPLSIFDLHSQFTICCGHFIVDGVIARDVLTLTRIVETEIYHKVSFHSEKEFEIYLRLELRRQLQ